MGEIQLQGVTVVHDGQTVLEDVDLHVQDGEVVALLGASGSGKTSLLRVIAGFDPVQSGRVLVGGQDVTDWRSRDRGLGMVAQGAPLHPTRDVEGNLRLPLELRGDKREEAGQRARGVALRFGLRRLLGRAPRQLSTGERAAAATARSVVRHPSGLLLDEPATHLDPQTRAAVLQQVGIVQRTQGTTILLATNDLGVATSLADRVAVLDRGTIAQVDILTALRAAPVTLDVADLVFPAPLSRLAGRVVPGGSGTRTRIRTAAGELPTWHREVTAHTGPVLVGLAPHELALTEVGAGELHGTVERVTSTGARRQVTVRTPAGPITVDQDAAEPAPPAGAPVDLSVTSSLIATTDGDLVAVLRRP